MHFFLRFSRWLLVPALFTASLAGAKELKVFILAGQSNMVGHGKMEMGFDPEGSGKEIEGGIGSMRWLIGEQPEKFGPNGKMPIVDAEGKWLVRDDVFIHFTYEKGVEKGALAPGFGKGNWIGPEYAFGHVIGSAVSEPVLLIKTAWGGKDLGVDFRPPSSGDTELGKGKREPGAYYREMIEIIKTVLANFEDEFPDLKGYTPELVGFGWHQGWNDGGSKEMVEEYGQNLENLIHDVRKDLNAPELRFVIANTGMIGWPKDGKDGGIRAQLADMQLSIADPKKYPDLAGTVAAVETRDFDRPREKSPSNFGYHWKHNGESHWLIGEAMAEAMLELIEQ
ncbi:MAG: sialate O-acetylesterase [Verrucomicrobiales bacterium]|nr:sialate O-acetylesterase [Verrucomicrobiales bacterium]